MNLVKNQRVRLEVCQIKEPGDWSLAGVQSKLLAETFVVEGVVTHIRGDHPTKPTQVKVWVLQDDGQELVIEAGSIVRCQEV